MRISTKGLYAVRMMLYLAEQDSSRAVSLNEIAKTQEISKKYLEQIVPSLTAVNLVRAQRGSSGGYRLAKSPSSTTMLEILLVTEGSLAPTNCLENEAACSLPQSCRELSVWRGLHETIEDYLGGITLQDILDESLTLSQNNFCI